MPSAPIGPLVIPRTTPLFYRTPLGKTEEIKKHQKVKWLLTLALSYIFKNLSNSLWRRACVSIPHKNQTTTLSQSIFHGPYWWQSQPLVHLKIHLPSHVCMCVPNICIILPLQLGHVIPKSRTIHDGRIICCIQLHCLLWGMLAVCKLNT